ncbi:MAG TPA: DUF6530 family protein [Chthoniobacterales bacterium]|jgi:hypothetical protein|nr:DUF6530 family protein [Chthoniobacterales bacterium]
MPFNTIPRTPSVTPRHALPQHLDHTPVFALPYDAFDGPFAGSTDVQYLSVGLAQYDPYDASIKTMRHTGTKWTRQAEELPLHRPVDMTLFLAKVMFDAPGGTVDLPHGTLHNQTCDVVVTEENRTPGERSTFNTALNNHRPIVLQRLNALRDVLNDLKGRGRI